MWRSHISPLVMHDKYTNFTAICFECNPLHNHEHSALAAKSSNQQSQETTAKRIQQENF